MTERKSETGIELTCRCVLQSAELVDPRGEIEVLHCLEKVEVPPSTTDPSETSSKT